MNSHGDIMKKIEIEDDLYKYILTNIEAFGETPSQILRRLLALPATIDAKDVDSEKKEKRLPKASTQSDIPELFTLGVEALFADPKFQKEAVITNKFKMMLTAMYHENRAAFVVAANTTKGRTRDYFGQSLTALLASDNEEEVAQLKASKPHDIPYTPFWVITNANTGRKRIILKQMMASMGYPQHLIERIKDEV